MQPSDRQRTRLALAAICSCFSTSTTSSAFWNSWAKDIRAQVQHQSSWWVAETASVAATDAILVERAQRSCIASMFNLPAGLQQQDAGLANVSAGLIYPKNGETDLQTPRASLANSTAQISSRVLQAFFKESRIIMDNQGITTRKSPMVIFFQAICLLFVLFVAVMSWGSACCLKRSAALCRSGQAGTCSNLIAKIASGNQTWQWKLNHVWDWW